MRYFLESTSPFVEILGSWLTVAVAVAAAAAAVAVVVIIFVAFACGSKNWSVQQSQMSNIIIKNRLLILDCL